jgi:hypothetical protein
MQYFVWLAIGFIPIYAAMELAWRNTVKRGKMKNEATQMEIALSAGR